MDLGLLALLDLLGIVGRHLGGVVGGGECDRDLDGVLVWMVEVVAEDATVHTSVCVLDSVT
jgi:hypothetical protein